jgi:hypothetical protein
MLSACQPVGDGLQSGSQEEKGGRGVQTTEPTAEGRRVGDAIWIFEGRCCAFQRPVLQEIPSQGLATGDQAVMGIRQGENGKAGEGQMAGPTHAAANFDPIVSLVMSLLAPPCAVIESHKHLGQRRGIGSLPVAAQSKSGLPGSPRSGIKIIVLHGKLSP